MAQVLRSIPDFTYQPERGRFRDWLGAVTRTKLLRFLSRDARAGKGGEAEELTQQVEDPESDALWNEGFEARVLEVAMQRARPDFEETTWRIFERYWVDGRSAPEVSRELGVAIESVYVAKSPVLKRLRLRGRPSGRGLPAAGHLSSRPELLSTFWAELPAVRLESALDRGS